MGLPGIVGLSAFAVLGVAVALGLWLRQEVLPPEIHALDGRFRYEGRWQSAGRAKIADWPCTAVHFNVEADPGGGSLALVFRALRTRLAVTVHGPDGSRQSWDVFGPWTQLPWLREQRVPLRGGNSTVTFRKLSSPRPFGTGWGGWLEPSVWEFHGIRPIGSSLRLQPAPRRRRRRIELLADGVGLGDCVEGSPDLSVAASLAFSWQHQSCEASFIGHVAEALDAELDVQALSGIGIMQNAQTEAYFSGRETMLSYWSRRLQSDDSTHQPHRRPDLLIVNLGSSDFQQHGGKQPHNVTFRTVYNKLLHAVVSTYGGFLSNLTIAAVCGMGAPSDGEKERGTSRCTACPYVQEAVDYFKGSLDLHADAWNVEVHYLEVPCDGTVLRAVEDFGCLGLPNRRGQRRIAEFLLPWLRTILHW
ncbi:unnamed protein product [Symbiodinium sp. CCMP2592]|nr:unnamed protein product [Symbiodinium sp. CCMP2592]